MIEGEASALSMLQGLPEWNPQAAERLTALEVMLREENQQQNLVSAGSLQAFWQRHIADSAQLLSYVPRETGPWLDLGTGAGFPGLVVAILRPELAVAMVESRGRRIDWLDRVIDRLGLDQARTLSSRLEMVESFPAGAISARAFAPLDRLISLAARFSTKETTWVLPKGRSAGQELAELRGWAHTFHVEQSLTDAEAGVIVGRLLGRKGQGK